MNNHQSLQLLSFLLTLSAFTFPAAAATQCGMLNNHECVPGGNSCFQDPQPSHMGAVSCMCQAVCLGGIPSLPIVASRTALWGLGPDGPCSFLVKGKATGTIGTSAVSAHVAVSYTPTAFVYIWSDASMDCWGSQHDDSPLNLPC